MSILESIILFGAMVFLAAIPSTSVAVVITRSAAYGMANGVSVALGIVMADLVFVMLAIFGLSAFSDSMGSLFIVAKYLGAAYLLWFGFMLLKAKNPTVKPAIKLMKKGNFIISFLAGFTLTLGDIKAILFYASFLPIFIDISALQTLDVLIVALITILSVGGVKIGYAILAKSISTSLIDYKYKKMANNFAGGFMLGAGSYIIAKA